MKIKNYQPKNVQANRATESNLPSNHHISIIYSSKGTGKTNFLLNMVSNYDKTHFFQKVYLFSPSYESDPKYEHLHDGSYELHVYHDFTNEVFEAVIEDIKNDLQAWNDYQHRLKLYEKLQRAKSLKQFTQEDLFELHEMQYERPEPPFEKEPFSLIIYDDLASNRALMGQGKSIANQFALRCRHFRTSICYIVQQYKNALPKMVRNNADVWVLAKSKSSKDMESVAEELTSYASLPEIVSMWDKATEEPYNYFVVNLMATPEYRFTKNFETPITA
jgi:hypothetical protein